MAASWHTMAVISCPILFTHFTEFLLGINTSVLGGRVWILLTTSSCKLDPLPRVWCQPKTPNFGISHPTRGCLCWFGTVEGWPRWGEPGTLVATSAVHPLLPSPANCHHCSSVWGLHGEGRGEQRVGGVTAEAAQAELHSSGHYLQLLSRGMKTRVLTRSWRRRDVAALC